MIHEAIVKLNRLCNMACPYCYFINSDTERPGERLSQTLLNVFLDKYYRYLQSHETQGSVHFHGGEPLINGIKFFQIALSHRGFSDGVFQPVVQTNGILLNEQWIRFFKRHNFEIGISFDGPRNVQDLNRPLLGGQGSYDRVVKAIQALQEHQASFGILCVVDPNQNGAEVYNDLRKLELNRFDFLLPMGTWESKVSDRSYRAGVQKFLIDALAAWLPEAANVRIRIFDHIFRRALGHKTGFGPLGSSIDNPFIILDTNGKFIFDEDLQDSSIASTSYSAAINIDVMEENALEKFEDITSTYLRLHVERNVSHKCKTCNFFSICGGGNAASRFRSSNGYNNVSINCNALFSLSSIARHLTATTNARESMGAKS